MPCSVNGQGDGVAGTQRRHRFRLLAVLPNRSTPQNLREKAEFKRLVADLEHKYTALEIQSARVSGSFGLKQERYLLHQVS